MGHDHDVIAASPEDLAGPPERDPPAPLWRSLLLGALFAAALGCAEMAWRMHAALTPSVARRSPLLLLNAALVYALAGGALTLPLAWLSRVLEVRYAPRFQRAVAGLACLLLAAATFAAALASGQREPAIDASRGGGEPAQRGPNLILIVVDTLRADALGSYGGPPTPHLDALAAGGLVFEETVAPSSWTLPSMASLFSGAYPVEHGFTDFDGTLSAERTPSHLAEILSRAGWTSRAVVGNTLLDPNRGFGRGFAVYDIYELSLERELWVNRALNWVLRKTGHVRSKRRTLVPVVAPRFPFVDTRLAYYNLDEDVTERVFRHALPEDRARPLFLYVHYIAPHTPYLLHPRTWNMSAPEPREVPERELRARYAGEVAYVDAEIGRLLERLEADGLLEDAVICLTADHGEAFDEHGRYEHGYDLHREALRVPWILTDRGRAAQAGEEGRPALPRGVRFAEPVSLSDLAPTLLELVGLDPRASAGTSLVPAIEGRAPAPAPVFAETSSRFLTPQAHHLAAFTGTLRLLRVLGDEPSERWFDVALDPGEQDPRAIEADQRAEALAAALDGYAAKSAEAAAAQAAADLQGMEALGYTEGDREDQDP